MKIVSLSTMLIVMLGLALPSAVAAQDKIGYVDLMAVLEGTIEGKNTVNKLKKDAMAKEAQFKKRMQALGERFQQFQSRAKMMKEEKAAEEARSLQKEEQELKMQAMQFQQEFQKKQAEMLSGFQKKLQGVIEAVAKREGLTFVFRHEVLLYGPPKMDITRQIIREYDKRFGAKGKKGK